MDRYLLFFVWLCEISYDSLGLIKRCVEFRYIYKFDKLLVLLFFGIAKYSAQMLNNELKIFYYYRTVYKRYFILIKL
jgi:hypothetical protein